MEKHRLESCVDSKLSIREIAIELNLSSTAVRYWLAKFDLKTCFNYSSGGKKGGIRKSKVLQLGLEYLCERCGETEPNRFYNARNRCKSCHNKKQIERLREYKRKAIEYKGGKCCKCGYDKCQPALDFHHIDPTLKDPNWKRMRAWSFEKVKKELDKCILVCGNCHAEIHYGLQSVA